MRKLVAAMAVAAVLSTAGAVLGSTYTQGFEGLNGSYNWYMDTDGSSAQVSTLQAHSGLQSAQLSLSGIYNAQTLADNGANMDYVRWKSADISALGITLGNLTASDWVMRTLGNTALTPYLIFSVAKPADVLANNTGVFDNIMVIESSYLSATTGVWTENDINGGSAIHITGSGFSLPANEFDAGHQSNTLTELRGLNSGSYSVGGVPWSDMIVTYVRVSAGLWPDAGAFTAYADDLSVSSGPTAVPEPISMIFFGTGLVAVGGFVARRRMLRKA